MATQIPSRGPLRGSHLRQVSTGSSSLAKGDGELPGGDVVMAKEPHATLAPQSFVLSVHDENFSKEDVVLNLAPNHLVREGDVLEMTPSQTSDSLPDRETNIGNVGPRKSLFFLFKPVGQELLSKQPTLQISVPRLLAAGFGFAKGDHVLVSTADMLSCYATHVEIVFRDQYLARADMWRLIVSELANKCVYSGQKIEFMGTIRATIKTIFVKGRKVPRALFHSSTKPIFRSESARYVLFIQMSKEMWDFDAQGSGEIMFDKVINGFLPELFKRWNEMKVKHLVSIVLFTKMIYEEHAGPSSADPESNAGKGFMPKADRNDTSKDFYRVVVSDIISGEWADILNRLKREFKVFLKNISIRKPDTGDHLPLGEGLSSAMADTPSHVIAGRPSVAMRGNLLQAINLASSQFSSDYIDRDLVRTGVSIVVISPGVGVFEVDYNLLVKATENLIDNGVGIDLVCLSSMPLHSVPLFKYHPPPTAQITTLSATDIVANQDENTPTGSLADTYSSGTPPSLSIADDTRPLTTGLQYKVPHKGWNYGIPHWIDISYWTSSSEERLTPNVPQRRPKDKSSFDTPQHKTFIPRVKMYELQMMGVMENAISDISIPHLLRTSHPSIRQQYTPRSAINLERSKSIVGAPVSTSFSSQNQQTKHTTPALSNSFASDRSISEKPSGLQFQWMDDYDDLVFRHPRVARKRSRKLRSTKTASKSRQQHRYSPSLLGSSADTRNKGSFRHGYSPKDDSYLGREMLKRLPSQAKGVVRSDTVAKSSNNISAPPKVEKTARKISFGPRGFSAKAVASTEVTTKHGKGSLLSRGLRSGLAAQSSHSADRTTPRSQRKLDPSVKPDIDVKTTEISLSSESESQQSRPIPIRNATTIRITSDGQERAIRESRDGAVDVHLHDRLAALRDLREQEEDAHTTEPEGTLDTPEPLVALSPSTTLAPWLTILNPSNPSKAKTTLANRLGRWQHLFPRPLKASQIKWKSLCSPAAVPLTTEEFPSAEQLAEEYEGTTYDIELPENSDLPETRSLVAEILAFRLSRGFQIVVGARVAESIGTSSLEKLDVFNDQILTEIGTSVFLLRGSTIHRISRLRANTLEVKQLSRYSAETKDSKTESSPYTPFICSTLGQSFEPQSISITPHRNNFDWKMIDSFVVGHERPKAQDFVDNLRPWRARFVLIPVEASSNTRRSIRSNEDDEEEIRLEGIRKLTQVWQRFRYIPPDERRYQAPLRNRKDTNPLDIMYQTRNPSAIVAAELENVAEGDATGRQVQLLPESDLFQRSNYKIPGLAETIQSEKGVRMLDRRWHLRLHYNCFIGFELTDWLLQNFRDVDTRDEAVQLGNELMENGMFRHVEQRHNFRDGNYFYQIADDYRTSRAESRGWFGRGKPSVPSTPLSEDGPKELPTTGRSRSSSNVDSVQHNDPTAPVGKRKQLGVALSKSLIYDVDHRKRSYRPELVNLHYDRLHNPDNCYHIRVEWMNTTPRFVQEAVKSWATSVDRFGLRLVEVPLGEASSITSMHPFRAPYLIKLAHPPPNKQPQTYFDGTSFAPPPVTDFNFYQKAIMKRFNFVLDFEAASDFPADVDVTYSWGKPDYLYPQYVHRSGMLIAQITNEGHFLLLANRLYNHRGAANSAHPQPSQTDHLNDNDQARGPAFFRSSPHRGNHPPSRQSPRSSPYNSPSVRATLDIPTSATPNRGPTSLSSFPKHIDPTRPASTTLSTNADATKQEFEAFCNNADALAIFYDEVLSKASTPGPNTPFMGSKTPSKGPETAFNESSIPALALPGSVVGKRSAGEGSAKKTEAKTRVIGGANSPKIGGGAKD